MDLIALEALLVLLRKHNVYKYAFEGTSLELGPDYRTIPTTINDLADKETKKQIIVDELKKHLSDDSELLEWST